MTKVDVYIPKNINEEKKLFKKFESMNLENLNKNYFFKLFHNGDGEVGFCILNDTWAVIRVDENGKNEHYDVNLVSIE